MAGFPNGTFSARAAAPVAAALLPRTAGELTKAPQALIATPSAHTTASTTTIITTLLVPAVGLTDAVPLYAHLLLASTSPAETAAPVASTLLAVAGV